MNIKQAHIHIFLILTLILAGVSPACQFISGQSIMEICGADGSVKTADMPQDLAAFVAAPAPELPAETDHADMPDCAFCVSSASVKLVLADSAAVPVPTSADPKLLNARSAASKPALHSAYRPRGPPVILS
jgi:hypothetical protein